MKSKSEPASVTHVEIVEFETERVVKRIDVGALSERNREKMISGLMMNMDLDRFFVREVE